jgi:alkanesulfonate monooxygenase SsuD/methylene tetrahydromethanopterin reductase-like flavin-dependent oxidoreductase (luciferase family)
MWIPGVLSPETVRWCAERGYPYFGLGTALGPTCDLWDFYADEALKHGYQAGPENFGYVIPTFVAETDQRAQELGKGFLYGGGQNSFARPEHTLPPGYNSKDAIRRLAKQPQGSWLGVSGDKMRGHTEEQTIDPEAVRQKLIPGYERAQRNMQIIIGSPKTVIPKLKTILTVIRPGAVVVFNVQGPVSNKDRMTSIRLIAQEVIPALKEHAKQIDLPDALERTPGSIKVNAGVSRVPVVDRGPLKELGL